MASQKFISPIPLEKTAKIDLFNVQEINSLIPRYDQGKPETWPLIKEDNLLYRLLPALVLCRPYRAYSVWVMKTIFHEYRVREGDDRAKEFWKGYPYNVTTEGKLKDKIVLSEHECAAWIAHYISQKVKDQKESTGSPRDDDVVITAKDLRPAAESNAWYNTISNRMVPFDSLRGYDTSQPKTYLYFPGKEANFPIKPGSRKKCHVSLPVQAAYEAEFFQKWLRAYGFNALKDPDAFKKYPYNLTREGKAKFTCHLTRGEADLLHGSPYDPFVRDHNDGDNNTSTSAAQTASTSLKRKAKPDDNNQPTSAEIPTLSKKRKVNIGDIDVTKSQVILAIHEQRLERCNDSLQKIRTELHEAEAKKVRAEKQKLKKERSELEDKLASLTRDMEEEKEANKKKMEKIQEQISGAAARRADIDAKIGGEDAGAAEETGEGIEFETGLDHVKELTLKETEMVHNIRLEEKILHAYKGAVSQEWD